MDGLKIIFNIKQKISPAYENLSAELANNPWADIGMVVSLYT